MTARGQRAEGESIGPASGAVEVAWIATRMAADRPSAPATRPVRFAAARRELLPLRRPRFWGSALLVYGVRVLALAREITTEGEIRTLGTVSGPPPFKMTGRVAVLGSV